MGAAAFYRCPFYDLLGCVTILDVSTVLNANPQSSQTVPNRRGGCIPAYFLVQAAPALRPRTCSYPYSSSHTPRLCYANSMLHGHGGTHKFGHSVLLADEHS